MTIVVILTVVIDDDGDSVTPYMMVNPPYAMEGFTRGSMPFGSIKENKVANEIHQNLLNFAENMEAVTKKGQSLTSK